LTISAEAKLTEDELMIIMFSSLDHDYLTNLLVLQGQFTMWFDLNFEGETQEEIDFRVNKCELWTATVKQAKNILANYKQMDAANKEEILTKQWWEHKKYSNFGTQLKKAMEDRNKMQEIRDIFRQ
jgi:hypothetical protein